MGLVNTAELKQLSRLIKQLEAENLALRRLYDGMTRYMADSDMLWRDLRNVYEGVVMELAALEREQHDEQSDGYA